MATPSQSKKCPHCAEEINIEAKKCKHCGEFLEQKPVRNEGSPAKKMPYWKAVPQFIGAGLVEIGMGIALSFTIIGGIVGIPLILMGIVSILGSPLLALSSYEGRCPECQRQLVWSTWNRAVKCRSCKQRWIVRDMHLTPMKVAR